MLDRAHVQFASRIHLHLSAIMSDEALREHVKHIRSVHATLLLTSLALLFASLITYPDRVQEAKRELRSIRLALGSIKPMWYSDYMDSLRAARVFPSPSARALTATVENEGGETHTLCIDNPAGRLMLPDRWTHEAFQDLSDPFSDPLFRVQANNEPTQGLPSPISIDSVSVRDLRQFWDKLNGLTFVYRVDSAERVAFYPGISTPWLLDLRSDYKYHAVGRDSGTAAHGVIVMNATDSIRVYSASLQPADRCSQGKRELDKSVYYIDRKTDTNRWWVYQELSTSDFVIRSWLGDEDFEVFVNVTPDYNHQLLRWFLRQHEISLPAASFAENFPQLNDLTRGFDQVTLGQAEAIMETLAQEGADAPEILGIRIPRSALHTFGVAVVVALLCYITYLITAFGDAADPAGRAAWMSIYPPARLRPLIYGSITIIPTLLITIVLLKEGKADAWSLAARIATILFCVFLSGYAFRGLRAIERTTAVEKAVRDGLPAA
jgi:hypothetical protein